MTTLKVQRRNMETKAKKLRREGYVTGNLFGKEIEGSIPLQIEKQEAERIERECMKGSQLYLELDGKTYDVLIKEMDYRPMDHQILEMDFQALVKGEKVHSVAEVILLNKEKVTEGVLEQLLEEIAYKVGFQTLSTFHRNFAKLTGISPLQWKKNGNGVSGSFTNMHITAKKGWE